MHAVHLICIRGSNDTATRIRRYIRCNVIIVRRCCGYGCLRAGVDILLAILLLRRYRFTVQRIGNADRAVCRRCNRYNRLLTNHHVDRSRCGQAVDGVGEGLAVAVGLYLFTVYLPAYDLIRGWLFIGKGDAAVGRAISAIRVILNFCAVCGVFCGQRATVCNSISLSINNTEVYLGWRCAVVDQCAYPDIALQIANRVAQSGNA